MTAAEKQLWEQLRKNKLGIRFKPQHPMKYFIADFYSYALRLVIEIDGPIHEFQITRDREREAEIIELGNTIIRFTNDEVINDVQKVVNKIKAVIEKIKYEKLRQP